MLAQLADAFLLFDVGSTQPHSLLPFIHIAFERSIGVKSPSEHVFVVETTNTPCLEPQVKLTVQHNKFTHARLALKYLQT